VSAPPPFPTASVALQSLVPTPIPLGDAELVNPLRGLYRWRGQELMPTPDPLPRPALDAYERYTWRQLEPAPGQYDFSAIEQDFAQASAEGRRFGFRVRALVSGQTSVPDYLMREQEADWWLDYDDDGEAETYVPDWNDPLFLERADKLFQALGARFDGDPNLVFVDIGLYGNWGEWHLHGFPDPPGAAEPISDDNKRVIVDMHLRAFPSTFLLASSNDTVALAYAFERSPKVGWRRDSLGDPHFDDLRDDPERWRLLRDRWRTAPVVTEFISPADQRDPAVFLLALEQARAYHVSLVGNGNTFEWHTLSDEGRAAFVELGKRSGYRLGLVRLELPQQPQAGEPLPLRMHWSNTGSAPVYEPWQIVVQLREPAGGPIVWEDASVLDLRQVMPAEHADASPPQRLHEDSFALPAHLLPGEYDLALLVRDPAGRLAPLELAIRGRQADGSYLLGQITLR
jgi:hypothetical protein